jgi:hypothetical protein
MATRFVATQTRSALDALATEHERTTAEQDAFAEFHDRITAMDVSQASLDNGHDQRLGVQAIMQSQPNKQLQRVRKAYRETIMSVSHYNKEYHDLLPESLAKEFGPEIASALTTGKQFTSPLRDQLLKENQQARAERTTFLKSLSRETEDLRSVNELITEIGSNLDTLNIRSLETWAIADLTESHNQLLAAEERCEELSTMRQSTLQNPRIPGPTTNDLDLNEYLYQSLSITYPVLADLADLADTLRTERSRVECTLCSY